MSATMVATDICPRCTLTPDDIARHGPTAGVDDLGWLCERCRYRATDLGNARHYAARLDGTDPARIVGRLLIDAGDSRPVNPMTLARATGAMFKGGRYSWPRAAGPERIRFDLLCELAFLVASEVEHLAPWHASPAGTVAEMITAAIRAAGLHLVDVLDEPPAVDDDDRHKLATGVIDQAENGGTDYAASIGRLFALAYPHASRDDALAAVLTAVVDELRDDAHRFGRLDGDGARAIIAALAAAGFAITGRKALAR